MVVSFFGQLLADDFDQEEEEKDFLVIAAATTTWLSQQHTTTIRKFYVRDRMEWERHVATLEKESPLAFNSMYRMSFASFMKLVGLVEPLISLNGEMSTLRTKKQPIITEIALHCLLRWLAGGSYLDI